MAYPRSLANSVTMVSRDVVDAQSRSNKVSLCVSRLCRIAQATGTPLAQDPPAPPSYLTHPQQPQIQYLPGKGRSNRLEAIAAGCQPILASVSRGAHETKWLEVMLKITAAVGAGSSTP